MHKHTTHRQFRVINYFKYHKKVWFFGSYAKTNIRNFKTFFSAIKTK